MIAPAKDLRRQIARVVKTARGNMGRGAAMTEVEHHRNIGLHRNRMWIYHYWIRPERSFYGVGLGELLMRPYEQAQARIWRARAEFAVSVIMLLAVGVWLAVR